MPEINLTPQLAQRIADALPGRRAVTLHSRLAAGERRRDWRRAAAGEADLVLGTRLAVFAPLPRLALIVVDEEHDPSFKQQDGVRYHGRDVAVWRARQRARADRARQRDAVARDAAAGAARALRLAAAAAARGRAGAACRHAFVPDTRAAAPSRASARRCSPRSRRASRAASSR